MPNEIKREAGEPPMGEHSQHNFKVQFNNKRFTVSCNQHQTVLDAIKSLSAYEKKITCPEDQIVLQLGQADKKTAITTHFPCTLIEEGELVVLLMTKEKVEEVKGDHDLAVLPKEEYSVFYVETKGGKNAKTIAKRRQGLFSCSAIKDFTRLCVYGPKDMTVKEALVSDGRFANISVNFYLSDVDETDLYTESTQLINSLHCKTFRISFEWGTQAKIATQEIPKLSAVSVKTVLEKAKEGGGDAERIHEILRSKFPIQREIIATQFPQNTLQEELDKVDFGKIQQVFSDFHRIRKFIELGESVCLVVIPDLVDTDKMTQGNAFVLLENYILTNAHLLADCIEGEKTLKTNVKVLFNYEHEILQNNALQPFCLTVDNTIIDFDSALDYAVLKLQPDDTNPVPPGLLKCLSPKPEDVGACIIGHVPGSTKKMDLTFIIEKERRMQSAEEKLKPLKKDPVKYIANVRRFIDKENLAMFMVSDDVITYDTFMYHGSSGSPVFDAEGRVFALHSGGFVYNYPESQTHGVIEFARPLLDIFRNLVTNLKARTDDEEAIDLLVEIKKTVIMHNPNLVNILSECGV